MSVGRGDVGRQGHAVASTCSSYSEPSRPLEGERVRRGTRDILTQWVWGSWTGCEDDVCGVPALQVAKKMVEKLGCTAEVAGNGLEAVQMIKNAPWNYDLVLMDLRMPVMDGIEATRCSLHFGLHRIIMSRHIILWRSVGQQHAYIISYHHIIRSHYLMEQCSI